MNFFVFLGGLIGYMTDRFSGLLIGALIGYLFARFVAGHLGRAALRGAGSAARRMQTRFLDSTFAVMGAVCKADGQVSEQEIRVAEQLFAQLHMDQAARESARAAFRRGKSPGFDLDAEVATFAAAARGNRMLLQMFLQVQLSAMTADGALHPAERQMLLRIARGLGISQAEVESLEALLRGGFSGGWQGQGAGGSGPRPTSRQDLEDAYKVLGVSPGASDQEIKTAYRRLMSQHHPDKLAARGLPETMREMAERKTREITNALQLIQRARSQA